MRENNSKLKKVLGIIFTIIASVLVTLGVEINILRPSTTETIEKTVEIPVDTGSSIEFSKEDVPVEISGEIAPLLEGEDIKTIDEVDGGQLLTEEGNQVNDVTSARGAFYRTDTYEHFIEDTIDKCVVEGNIYGAQCVSLAQAFWTNYAGFGLNTCGTGAARGLWTCKETNAGDAFVLVASANDIQPGDWIITNGGTWGHVAMAVGSYNNGYIAVYGENQGGTLCAAGGSQPNIINLSMKTFLGAFRPTTYVVSDPAPETPDTGATR